MGADPTLELCEDCARRRMSALPSGKDALSRHRKAMTALMMGVAWWQWSCWSQDKSGRVWYVAPRFSRDEGVF